MFKKMTYDELKAKYNMPKQRKVKNAHIEDDIQSACAQYFAFQYPEPCIFTTSTAGINFAGDEVQRIKTWKRLEKMGHKVGSPDVWVLLPHRVVLALEFKTPTGKQSEAQKRFEKNCLALGHKYYVIRSLDEFIKVIKENYKPI
jgi:hypothetical protein